MKYRSKFNRGCPGLGIGDNFPVCFQLLCHFQLSSNERASFLSLRKDKLCFLKYITSLWYWPSDRAGNHFYPWLPGRMEEQLYTGTKGQTRSWDTWLWGTGSPHNPFKPGRCGPCWNGESSSEITAALWGHQEMCPCSRSGRGTSPGSCGLLFHTLVSLSCKWLDGII